MVQRTDNNSANSMIDVQIARMGESIQTFALAAGATVADALDAAGIDQGLTVKVDGEAVNLTDVLENGDRLLISGKVTGGNK